MNMAVDVDSFSDLTNNSSEFLGLIQAVEKREELGSGSAQPVVAQNE